MVINWFPGHMTKALRIMDAEIKNIDCAIYVLDSRAPFACLNPEFDKLLAKKSKLIVLNKIDMADMLKLKTALPRLKEHFGEGAEFVFLNSTASGALKTILHKLEILCAEKIERKKNRGINAFLKAMVVGVPNTGKSTLVNNLCGKAKAKTGNRPGVTRGKQWVSISEHIQVLDTAGTLYPKLSNEKLARQLAYIGSIKDDVLDINELAVYLIKDLPKQYPNAITERYNIIPSGEAFEILEQIAMSRHLIMRGGEVDYDRTCSALLDDFRKGRLGKITLF